MTSNHDFLARFKKALPQSIIITEKETLLTYGYDGTAGFLEIPSAVIFPKTVEEVSALVRVAYELGVPLIPRGAGTGLSGGSVPISNAVVVCLTMMDKIIEIDTKNLTILAESGVVTQKLANETSKVGLFYPPDPGSMAVSTIGGNVAENSGGLRGLKYGVTRNYVMGLEIVLPDGEVNWLGNKCVKDVAGLSLKDVFIGSEGTLGIITKVLLKLLPVQPYKKTMLVTFPDMDRAAQSVSDIIASKIIPCTLEFMDFTTIKCVEDYAKIGLPLDCQGAVLIESDGHNAVVDEEFEEMVAICKRNACKHVSVAANDVEANRLASARRTAFSALARIRPTTILEDATVPRSELAEFIRFIQATARKHNLLIGVFGHMGDGNLHPTVLTDERDNEEMNRVHTAFEEIFDKALQLGGTITGEHGVGLAKKPFLAKAVGLENIRLMQSLKKVVDPKNIMNPGKVIDLQD